MKKAMLVELKEDDQIERYMCRLQETVESGTSVIFSFPLPGRVMVLHARSQNPEEVNGMGRRLESDMRPSIETGSMELQA